MKRIAKAAAVATAGLGLLAGATPAHAAPGAVAFIGSATTSALGYPVLSAGVSNGTWTFSFPGGPAGGAAVGVSTTGPGTASGSVSGQLGAGAVQTATGLFADGAYCGLSGGKNGSGTITVDGVLGSVNTGVTGVGWAQSVASL